MWQRGTQPPPRPVFPCAVYRIVMFDLCLCAALSVGSGLRWWRLECALLTHGEMGWGPSGGAHCISLNKEYDKDLLKVCTYMYIYLAHQMHWLKHCHRRIPYVACCVPTMPPCVTEHYEADEQTDGGVPRVLSHTARHRQRGSNTCRDCRLLFGCSQRRGSA